MISVLGNMFGAALSTFISAAIITFIVKKILIAFSKPRRKAAIANALPVVRTAGMFAAAAAVLVLIGFRAATVGYYSIAAIVIIDMIIANSK